MISYQSIGTTPRYDNFCSHCHFEWAIPLSELSYSRTYIKVFNSKDIAGREFLENWSCGWFITGDKPSKRKPTYLEIKICC